MKTTPYIIMVILLSLCICVGFFLMKNPAGEIRVSERHDRSSFTFTASFPAALMPKVETYMDSCASLLRQDHLDFRIQTSTGELEIKADKKRNAPTGIVRIEKMCQGISAVIIRK